MKSFVMIDPAFPRHRKVRAVTRTMRGLTPWTDHDSWSRVAAIWLWAFEDRNGGDVTELFEDMALASRVVSIPDHGTAHAFLTALVACRLLDSGGGRFFIHDWQDGGGRVDEKRALATERKRRQRERVKGRHANVTQDKRDTSRGMSQDESRTMSRESHATDAYADADAYAEKNNISSDAATCRPRHEPKQREEVLNVTHANPAKPEREWSPKALELLAALESLEKFAAWDWRGKHADFLESEIRLNPYLDLAREAQKAHAWMVANPKKAKRDFKRFLHGWFERADQWRAKNEPSLFAKPNGTGSPDGAHVHPTVREFVAYVTRKWSGFVAFEARGIRQSREDVIRFFDGAPSLFEVALEFGRRGGFARCRESKPQFLPKDVLAVLDGWEPCDDFPLDPPRGGRGEANATAAASSPDPGDLGAQGGTARDGGVRG